MNLEENIDIITLLIQEIIGTIDVLIKNVKEEEEKYVMNPLKYIDLIV